MIGTPMTRLRCAILDDYLNLSLTAADWSRIGDRVDVTVFNQPFASPEAAAGALADYGGINLMRERTPFPRALFAALPKLKLLIPELLRIHLERLPSVIAGWLVLCGTQWARDP